MWMEGFALIDLCLEGVTLVDGILAGPALFRQKKRAAMAPSDNGAMKVVDSVDHRGM